MQQDRRYFLVYESVVHLRYTFLDLRNDTFSIKVLEGLITHQGCVTCHLIAF